MGETIVAGALEFHAEDRSTGQPHYHYAPMGQDLRYNIDPLTLDDGIGWVINLLGSKLPQVLAKAGYEQIATPENVGTAIAALPEVERRWRAVCARTAGV
jgi:hypothetical protein